jgi:hypothetical protein
VSRIGSPTIMCLTPSGPRPSNKIIQFFRGRDCLSVARRLDSIEKCKFILIFTDPSLFARTGIAMGKRKRSAGAGAADKGVGVGAQRKKRQGRTGKNKKKKKKKTEKKEEAEKKKKKKKGKNSAPLRRVPVRDGSDESSHSAHADAHRRQTIRMQGMYIQGS